MKILKTILRVLLNVFVASTLLTIIFGISFLIASTILWDFTPLPGIVKSVIKYPSVYISMCLLFSLCVYPAVNKLVREFI